MDPKEHWEQVYQGTGPEQLSWFQAEAKLSCQLITQFVFNRDACILDVGAGASTLIDGLLAAGYRQVTVLDLANAALAQSQRRVGSASTRVRWLEGDVLTAPLVEAGFDVWHDRAVFHFLTDAVDRARYVDQVRRAVRADGIVLVATFAEDGPVRCSGLDVRRYSAETLHHEFGADFRIVASQREEHVTPRGVVQAFTYCVCRYQPGRRVRAAA